MEVRACARRAFVVRQPKRDLQSVTRKGDTELSVRDIACVVSLVAALEVADFRGMPVQECERLLQALPPAELKINLAASLALAAHDFYRTPRH